MHNESRERNNKQESIRERLKVDEGSSCGVSATFIKVKAAPGKRMCHARRGANRSTKLI